MKLSVNAAWVILYFLWELPQNLLGLLVWLVVRKRILDRETEGGRSWIRVPDFGLSLGNFIFWSVSDPAASSGSSVRTDNRLHELGHAYQSRMLGPLYLFVVGIPSVCRFLFARMHDRRYGRPWTRYFDGYPEKWADRLGDRAGRKQA